MEPVMKRIALVFTFMFSAAVMFAAGSGQLWTKANDEYSMGQYESALNTYLEIEGQGEQSYK